MFDFHGKWKSDSLQNYSQFRIYANNHERNIENIYAQKIVYYWKSTIYTNQMNKKYRKFSVEYKFKSVYIISVNDMKV